MATSAGKTNYLKNNLYSTKTMRKLAKIIRINFFRTLKINQMAAIIIEHLFKKNAWILIRAGIFVPTLLSLILFSHLHSSLENQKFLIIVKIQSLISIGGSRMGLNLLQTPFAKKCHYLTYSVIFWNIPSETFLIDIRDNSVWIAFFWGEIY